MNTTTTTDPRNRPDDPTGEGREAVMGAMWAAFVRWTHEQPDVWAAFTAATGTPRPARPSSPIDALVDQACGVREKTTAAFVLWVTETMWGVDEAPAAVRDEIRAKRASA